MPLFCTGEVCTKKAHNDFFVINNTASLFLLIADLFSDDEFPLFKKFLYYYYIYNV